MVKLERLSRNIGCDVSDPRLAAPKLIHSWGHTGNVISSGYWVCVRVHACVIACAVGMAGVTLRSQVLEPTRTQRNLSALLLLCFHCGPPAWGADGAPQPWPGAAGNTTKSYSLARSLTHLPAERFPPHSTHWKPAPAHWRVSLWREHDLQLIHLLLLFYWKAINRHHSAKKANVRKRSSKYRQ